MVSWQLESGCAARAHAARGHWQRVRRARVAAWAGRVRRRPPPPSPGGGGGGGAETASALAEERRNIRELLAWVRASGGEVSSKLEVRAVSEGDRRLFAWETIAEGEVLMRIPAACHVAAEWPGMCPDEAREAESQREGISRQTFLLVVRLLREGIHASEPTGPLAVYYRTMPKFVDTPGEWPAEHLWGLAEHHRALHGMKKKRAWLLSLHASVRRCQGLGGVGWEDFLWVYTLVQSRTFGFGNGSTRELRFVPVADLANHHPTSGSFTDYSLDGAEFVMRSERGSAAGEEIYVTYGVMSNDKLLDTYGFSLSVNQEHNGYCPDEVTFILPLPADNPFKVGLLAAAGFGGNGIVQLSVTYTRKVPELFSILRLVAADAPETELIRARRPPLSSVNDLRSVSLRNEAHALCLLWRYVSGRCTGILPADDQPSSSKAYAHAVDLVQRSLLSGSTCGGGEAPEPAIIGIAREALRLHGGAEDIRPEDDSRVRDLASECVAPGPGGPGCWSELRAELGARRAPEHAAFVRHVVASDRRVFAHFAALSTLGPAVLSLTEAERERVLARLEDAPPLAGLRSRMLVARYVRGVCRYAAVAAKGPAG